ncbi:hypothetical protein BJY00DRAFT_272370 [Aspergillus carlsbadensis]|nr:hypothetical protein BJY00DRAFT_272370 [Aspergillus carlsbadensis]
MLPSTYWSLLVSDQKYIGTLVLLLLVVVVKKYISLSIYLLTESIIETVDDVQYLASIGCVCRDLYIAVLQA